MRRLLLPALVLAALQPAHSRATSCDGICGRRPLAASHNMLRLVGGSSALPGTWPWQVSVQLRTQDGGYRHFCGGSLISSRWVISAAHCFLKAKEHYQLILGCNRVSQPGPDSQSHSIKRVVKHKHFRNELSTGETIYNDIALLEMSHPANCSDYIQPACLPDDKVSVPSLPHCYISGWGTTEAKREKYPDVLQEAPVDLLSQWECSRMWDRLIHPMNLCSRREEGGAAACRGDSGSPLACREERSERFWVVGLYSWGSPECGQAERPSVFISTQHFLGWIKTVAKELPSSPTHLPLLAQSTPGTTAPPASRAPASHPRTVPRRTATPGPGATPRPRLRPGVWHVPASRWPPPWPGTTLWRPWPRAPGWFGPTPQPRAMPPPPQFPLQPPPPWQSQPVAPPAYYRGYYGAYNWNPGFGYPAPPLQPPRVPPGWQP